MRTLRLDLEPLCAAHADEAWPHVDDPSMWTFFPALRPESLDDLRATYGRRERGYPKRDGAQIWGNWLVRERSSALPVGDVQATIFPMEGTALVAYAVYVAHQRRGFARESLVRLLEHLRDARGTRRVFAEMDTRNMPSYRLAESLGFTRVETRAEEDRGTGLISAEYVYELRF
ncbi:MAG: GNAT family N-acetyltransferase [Rhodanobacteraceae bacterium]